MAQCEIGGFLCRPQVFRSPCPGVHNRTCGVSRWATHLIGSVGRYVGGGGGRVGVQRRRSAAAGETQGLDAVAALRHGRRVARLSQRDLARRAGVSQSLIARIEARRVDPPVGVMQRLLGCCGLRWELRLVVVGDTAVAVRRRRAAVTGSALRRSSAATDRRCAENAAARDSARRSAGQPFTVRARRQLAREARVAERAAQAIAYAELICVEDDLSRRAAVADGRQADRRLRRYLQHFRVPTADRLPARVGPARSAELTALLEALSTQWPWPPVAISGWAAAAIWSPGRHLPPAAGSSWPPCPATPTHGGS